MSEGGREQSQRISELLYLASSKYVMVCCEGLRQHGGRSRQISYCSKGGKGGGAANLSDSNYSLADSWHRE